MQGLVVADLDVKKREFLESRGVKDYTEELRFLTPEKLTTLFHHDSSGRFYLQKFLYNVIWQAYCKITAGLRAEIDGNMRSFWYQDVKTAIASLGLLQEKPQMLMEWDPRAYRGADTDQNQILSDDSFLEEFALSGDPHPSTSNYLVGEMTKAFDDFVIHGIFRFDDFGFQDDAIRYIGNKRRDVIFFAEKDGFKHFAEEIYDEFGCTSLCLGGQPRLISAQYLTDDLKTIVDLGKTEFLLIGCVDYDPAGAFIASNFQEQLKFFGLVKSKLVSLISPKLLTLDEVMHYRHVLAVNSKTQETIQRDWLKKTGGVNGELYGIESDVVPRKRIRDAAATAIKTNGR